MHPFEALQVICNIVSANVQRLYFVIGFKAGQEFVEPIRGDLIAVDVQKHQFHFLFSETSNQVTDTRICELCACKIQLHD